MRLSLLKKLLGIGFVVLAVSLFANIECKAQLYGNPYYNTGQTYYGPMGYYPPQVLLVPTRSVLVIPRQGSNDSQYIYDNVYGPEASAAGRMSRTVVNPPPQYYIRPF